MKKIGKKLSYFAKVFMAFGLLFYNVSSISIVFADENTGEESSEVSSKEGNGELEEDNKETPAVGDTEGEEGNKEEQNDEEETPGENSEATEEGEESGEGNSSATTEGEEGTETGETPEENETPALEFSVDASSGWNVVINHNMASDLTGSMMLYENFTYTDGSEAGENAVEIPLSDDVKNALANDGYSYESEMLGGNSFNGTYSVRVVIGEEERTDTYVFNETAEGMDFDLLYMTGDAPSEGEGYMPMYDVAEANEEGKYVIPTDATEVIVVGWLNPGGITPSMTFNYNGTEYTAQEMFWGIDFDMIEFDGQLHGEFTKEFTVTSSNGKTYSKSFLIVYGEYQDNTDKLNESAKNVGLDSSYIFVGDSANGTVYYLDELNEDDIKSIIEDAFGSETIEYTVGNGSVTIKDANGIVVTYGEAELSNATQIAGVLNAILDSDNNDVTSGDTFTVNYVVTLKDFAINGISGTVKYDEEILKLINIEAKKFTGNNNEGKFIYLGDESIMGTVTENEDGSVTINDEDYILLTLTFEALKEGTSTITVEDAKFFNGEVYYGPSDEIETEIVVNASSDSSLASLTVAGQDVSLSEDQLEYAITVGNDVTMSDVLAVATNSNATISVDGPQELAVGENVITITVTSEDGSSEKVYTVKVTREEPKAEAPATVAPVTYQEATYDDNSTDEAITPDDSKKKDEQKDDTEEKEEKKNDLSRIIIIILILLVIAGLIYLIFKDDDDEETKKANKDIDKFKKEDSFGEKNTKYNNNRNNKNNKKGR